MRFTARRSMWGAPLVHAADDMGQVGKPLKHAVTMRGTKTTASK